MPINRSKCLGITVPKGQNLVKLQWWFVRYFEVTKQSWAIQIMKKMKETKTKIVKVVLVLIILVFCFQNRLELDSAFSKPFFNLNITGKYGCQHAIKRKIFLLIMCLFDLLQGWSNPSWRWNHQCLWQTTSWFDNWRSNQSFKTTKTRIRHSCGSWN